MIRIVFRLYEYYFVICVVFHISINISSLFVYIRVCFIVLENIEGECNQNANGNVNNNGEENVFDQLAQTLAVLVNQQPKPNIVSQFKRLNPPTFDWATDPAVVEMWIQEMEKAFGLLGSNEEQKVTLAVYQLQGSAYDWWLMEK